MSYFYEIRTRNSLIRPLPYPFRGSLALSTDCEFFSWSFFKELTLYLNTEEQTAFGPGLGLEVTGSLFFYSDKPYNFSYFSGLEVDSPESKDSHEIRRSLEMGWFDTIHAYGDFDQSPSFTRAHAERVRKILSGFQHHLKVFSNHGSADNLQNVGGDASYHHGDRADAHQYHLDLLKEIGIEYFWTDSLVDLKSKKTEVVPEVLVENKEDSFFRSLRRLFNPENQMTKAEVASPEPAFPGVESLLRSYQFQDGSTAMAFRRFRSTGRNAPNLSSFKYQMDQICFDDLYDHSGAMIIYQHFGVLHRENAVCTQATIEEVLRRPEVYLTGFETLRSEVKKGKLWVPGLAKYLTYLKMISEVDISRREDRFELNCPNFVANPKNFFQGLTIYIEKPEDVKIYYGNEKLDIDHNGPDETGSYSVTIKMQKALQF